MADVFVSYSRRDTAYVKRLVDALAELGKDVWLDTAGIRDAEVFPEALRRAVEGSDAFVFVISPESVRSPFCEQEVYRAVELNKRIVPLSYREVPDEEIPDEIRYRNWIPAGNAGEFGPTLERLIKALDTDLEWEHEHTRLTVKGLEWDGAGRDRSFLLRGSDLTAGEQWLAASAGKDPGPTQLERDYLLASRAAATRRQRALVGASLGVAVVSIALLVFALISRSNAISARNTAKQQALTAKSQALAAESQTQLAIDPERSVLLATAAVREQATSEALFALRGALDASPIRFRLPDAGLQTCGFVSFDAPGAAFSPDGRTLAEGLCNGTVVFADARTGHVLRRVRVGPTAGPLSYNRSGSLLAASVGPNTMLVNPATGAVRGGAPRTKGAAKAAFDPVSPDELAIADTSHVTLWNMRTQRARTIAYADGENGPPPSDVAFSRDGRRLAISFAGNGASGQPPLIVIDVANGRRLAKSTIGTDATAFSRDGRTLIAAQTRFGRGGGRIAELDARTLKLRRTLQRLPDVESTAVAVSPDGTRAVYGAADGTAGLLSLETGRPIASYVGQTAAVASAAFSPDGRLAATASQDGTLRVWRAAAQARSTTRVGGFVDALRPTRNGFVVVGQPPGVRAGTFVQEFAGGRRTKPPLEISPTEDAVVDFISDDGSLAGLVPLPHGNTPTAPVQLWSVPRRRVIKTLPPATLPTGGQPVFSPDEEWIAMGLPPGSPPAGTAKGRRPPEPTARLAIRDTRSGQTRVIGTTSCGNGWRGQPFSRDGTLVAGGSFCGQVSVWNVVSGRPVGHPFSIGGELARLAFSPDATRIAAASWNSTITVADDRTGSIVAVLTDHTRGVSDVDYSPDGRYLASASLDGTVRIWDAHSLRLLRVLHQPGVSGAAFTPDSRRILTWNDSQVREWDACTACEDTNALLAIARGRVTRQLTPQERRTFGAG